MKRLIGAYTQPQKRTKKPELKLRSLPPQIILYILEFHDFSLKDCTVHFSCNHSQRTIQQIELLATIKPKKRTVQETPFIAKYKGQAADTVHKLLNAKMISSITYNLPSRFSKGTQITTFSKL